MKAQRLLVCGELALALLTLLMVSPVVAKGPPVHSVRGHAVWSQGGEVVTGRPQGGNRFDQLSISAWQDADGTARGILEWTYETNPLPGGGGQTISGYPWTVAIDTLIMLDDNWAYVEGVVINSGQVPEDVGSRVGFYFVDNGEGADVPPDELNFRPIDAGNFIVQ